VSASHPVPPTADLPSLAIRWDGLVVTVDAITMNTLVRRATYRVKEIEEILIEPEEGRLALTIKLRRGIAMPFRGELTSIRMRDGFLGFAISELKVFGLVPIPDWVLRRIVEHLPSGRAFYYPENRVFVINLNPYLPPELSLYVREVVCESGELKLCFGPSQYRLDRILEEIGTDPFSDD
jgi:hypothetical protein